MDLYFLRHGLAEPFSSTRHQSDSDRSLDNSGKKQIEYVGKGLKRMGESFTKVLVSPYLRAEQTARICLESAGMNAKDVEYTDHLTPHASISDFVGALYSEWFEEKSILFVTHQPFVGAVIAQLMSLHSEGVNAAMAPGSMCKLNVEKPGFGSKAILNWHMSAEQFEAFEV